MAGTKLPKPVVIGNTTYELVDTDVHGCGDGFLALQKTVARSGDAAPKVKKLVFNKDHRAQIGALFQ
jgi:hypothetical protein